jgi:hypothetical protein
MAEMPDAAPSSAVLGDVELAKLLLVAERELKAAKCAREALGDEVLARMQAGKLSRLEVPGEGLVTLVDATVAHPVDGKVCAAKLDVLGAQLRQLRAAVWRCGEALAPHLEWLGAPGIGLAEALQVLGEVPTDDATPLGTTRRAASLRITPRL